MQWFRVCAFTMFLSAVPAAVAAVDVSLVVSEQFAVVTESHRMSVSSGLQELVLDDIPGEADLSTLVVRVRRLPVRLVEWERIEPGHRSMLHAHDLTSNSQSDEVIWSPSISSALQPSSGHELLTVRCIVDMPASGEHTVFVSYRVPGFSWRADYRVALRGEAEKGEELFSLDFAGLVHVENPTARSFSNVTVTLVGEDWAEPRDPSLDEPGILILSELSERSAVWGGESEEKHPAYTYRLPRRMHVPARSTGASPIVQVERIPAEQLYRLKAEEFPLGAPDRRRRLQEMVVFKNEEARGLGVALPAGDAQVYRGGRRAQYIGHALIPHTPRDGEIRIDLGFADGVRGARVRAGRSSDLPGFLVEEYQVIVENMRGSDVRVEIDEKPPVSLEWNVVKASKAYITKSNRLLFQSRVKHHGETRITYTLRIKEPTI